MRIIQLIDSLATGGAERMAVNYAEGLHRMEGVRFSGLVVTRTEGGLKGQWSADLPYLFLNKKKTLDFGALFRLWKYCKQNRVGWIHAHSSSYFLAVLLKLVLPSIKIIWHDHYGNSEFLAQRPKRVVKIASVLFSKIIGVNELLVQWSREHLFCKDVFYLPNFVLFKSVENVFPLKGENGKRIVCLANLREQKNHPMLLEVAEMLKTQAPDWSFHLVGKDFEDAYSAEIRKLIIEKGLSEQVYVYGASDNTSSVLQQSEIGILTSKSEGLPVALLEYGYFGLAVVSTAVGEIPKVLEGICPTIKVDDVAGFSDRLGQLIKEESMRKEQANAMKQMVKENYTEKAVLRKYLSKF